MSLIAHHWKHKADSRGGSIKLFSNYELVGSEPIDSYKDWYKVAEAQGSIVCFDEAQMAFSNRKWSRYGAGIATEVLMFTRKMKAVLIYCSPNIKFVDSRIRDIVEVLINVRKIGDKGFSVQFTDYQTGEFMHKQFIPMYKAKQFFKLKLYDTDNMVTHFPLPQTEREGEEFFHTLNEIHDKARGKVRVKI